MPLRYPLVLLAALGLGLAACGGASSDSQTTPEPSSEPAPQEGPGGDARDETGCLSGDRFDACGGDPECPECDVCIPTCYGASGAYRPGGEPPAAPANQGGEGAACSTDADCADTMRCDHCASSSCDVCDDCVAACVRR